MPWQKIEEERWKMEDGKPEPENEELDHLQRVERQVAISMKQAEEDEFLHDRLALTKELKKVDVGQVAQNLEKQKRKAIDAALGINEEALIEGNFRTLKKKAEKVNKFSSLVKRGGVGK